MADGTVCRRAFSGDWFCGEVVQPLGSASAAPAAPSSAEAPKVEEKQCRYTRMAGDYVEVCEQKAAKAPASGSSILGGLRKLFGDIVEIMKQPNSFQKFRH